MEKNPLLEHLKENYPLEKLHSVEMFSTKTLTENESKLLFLNSYSPLLCTERGAKHKLSSLEELALLDNGLIESNFMISQVSNSYITRHNPIEPNLRKEASLDYKKFNEALSRVHNLQKESIQTLEELHAYHTVQLRSHDLFRYYLDPLCSYKSDCLSVLESNSIYLNMSICSGDVYLLPHDLHGFQELGIQDVAIFYNLGSDDASAFLYIRGTTGYVISKSEEPAKYEELKESLNKSRSMSALSQESVFEKAKISNSKFGVLVETINSPEAKPFLERISSAANDYRVWLTKE